MRAVRDICSANGSNDPVTIHELYKRMQKKTSLSIEKDELKSILDYYHKL